MGRRELDAATRDRLVVAVRKVCPAWLREHQEDLVQMTAMKLLRSSAEIETTDSYLARVAYTVVIDEIRRRKRRQEVGMSPSMPDRIFNSGQLTPEMMARGSEVGSVLVGCLSDLNPDRRRAVTLYLQDHSVPEIAELLGWDRKRASNLVYRGLDDLRSALRKKGLSP